MRPAGGLPGRIFGDLLLLAVGARRFIGSDSDGIQHRTVLMINPVTRQPARRRGHRASDALPGRSPGVAGAPGGCGYISAPGQEWRPALRRADA